MEIATALTACLLSILVARRWSLSVSLLWVYIPILMWVPLYFSSGIGGWAINPSSFVEVFLVGMALLLRYRHWRFSVMDVWVSLYALTVYYSDVRHHTVNFALFSLTTVISQCVFPYILGKTLIEQTNSREHFAKMLVICLAGVAFVSLYEFRMTFNPFQTLTERITHHEVEWIRQRRWGFARIAGPYGHAICAGMIFTTGLMLQIWLLATKRWETEVALSSTSRARLRKKIGLITVLVALGLFMTQSRGPWMGCAIGLIVAVVGLSKNRKRSAITAVILLAIALVTFYQVLDNYSSTSNASNSVEQQDAIYRRQLLTTYDPIIKEGGWWGWGSPDPMANGVGAYESTQPSIDNEYLRIMVAQGYTGVAIFGLIIVTSVITLVRHCVVFRTRQDYAFAFAMLGVVLATAFSLTTVFLGEPMSELLFLIFGWTSALRPTLLLAKRAQVAAHPKFEFERVLA